MSEKEKDIIKTIGEALPKMSERDKGYFLGYAEALASKRKEVDATEALASKRKEVDATEEEKRQ